MVLVSACGGDDRGGATLKPSTGTPAAGAPTAQVADTAAGARTPTSSPTPAQRTYTVVSGDTLFDIAQQFNTTVEALAAANGLADANVLAVGQVLMIP
jgi:LysM repeat protein